jgi:photosystem II stability/assembly factor-like uncharacterized protein
MSRHRLLAGFLIAFGVCAGTPVDTSTFSGLGIRTIGPAVMSGRVSALDARVRDGRLTVLVGSASGGLWKSSNGCATFKPVFDRHCQSIGAVTIDPVNPEVIWVGTGETWTRNSVSIGDGVYKSLDGGDSWTRMGLADSERIAAVVVDPVHPDTVFVAATGRLWSGGGERGVYRSRDGGGHWTRVLAGNDDTGCSSLAMDPRDPRILYAGMWQFRRKPWTFESGGPGSGLFKSVDGGSTWQRLERGLPTGPLGRVAVAVAPSDPRVVYALIEAGRSALFRSDDAGVSWKEVNNSFNVTARPFYFANLAVDPKDPMRLWKPGYSLGLSEDGGASFSVVANSIHGDFHPVWINPANPEQVIVGEDGGLASSQDRGGRWTMHRNLPLGQFYHVSADQETPYNVYGGLQDNDSWMAPSSAQGPIQNRHWKYVGVGGDGFWTFADPTDPGFVYSESQGGMLGRRNLATGEIRDIQPQAGAGEPKLRFNWNTPVHLSPHEKGTLYIGAQYLFRSRDQGGSWERISPDLTSNDPAKQAQEESGGLSVDNSSAETHTTLYTICESPRNGRLIWTGSDDGRLHLTRDGGGSWSEVGHNVPGLPAGAWVSWVQASQYREDTAYATFDAHAQGDMATYVFRTRDYGRTWQPLASSALSGYAHVIKEDPVNPELLFLGTELGLHLSLDGGRNWARFKAEGFPDRVAVRDLVVHPREHDLVLATHGRGIWIIDDISALRTLDPATLEREAAFLPGRPGQRKVFGDDNWANGDAEYDGPGPASGVVITYHLNKRHIFGELKLEVVDGAGQVIATLPSGKRRGINRVSWSMRLAAPNMAAAAQPSYASMMGPRVLDGSYSVRLTKAGQVLSAPLTVLPDARSRQDRSGREAQFAMMMRLRDLINHMTRVAGTVAGVRGQLLDRLGRLAPGPVHDQAAAILKDLEVQRGKLLSTREGDGGITGEEKIREHLDLLYGAVDRYEGQPTRSQLEREHALESQLNQVEQAVGELLRTRLTALNSALAGSGQAVIEPAARTEGLAPAGPGPAAPAFPRMR